MIALRKISFNYFFIIFLSLIIIGLQFVLPSCSLCPEYCDFSNLSSSKFLHAGPFYGNWHPENGMLKVGGGLNSNFGFMLNQPAYISFDWKSDLGKEGGTFIFKGSGDQCKGDSCPPVSHFLSPGNIEWQILGTGFGYLDNLSIVYLNDSCDKIYSERDVTNTGPTDTPSGRLNETENFKPKEVYKDMFNSTYVKVDPLNYNEDKYIFKNINNAIQAVDDYGTIELEESNYKEQVIINKPLTIKGSRKENVILNDIRNNSTILVQENDVTIENLTIKGYTNAIYLEHVSNCTIIHNVIENSVETGLLLKYSNENNISDNLINDCKVSGIAIDFSDNNLLDLNIIKNCLAGIAVYSSKENIFKENNKFSLINCTFLCIDSSLNEYPNGYANCTKKIDGKEHICMFYKNNNSCVFGEK